MMVTRQMEAKLRAKAAGAGVGAAALSLGPASLRPVPLPKQHTMVAPRPACPSPACPLPACLPACLLRHLLSPAPRPLPHLSSPLAHAPTRTCHQPFPRTLPSSPLGQSFLD